MNYPNNNDSYYNPVTIIQTNSWIKEIKSILNSQNIINPLIITSKGNNNRININKYFKDMTIIDWAWPAIKIHNWVRGLSPHPGMSTTLFQKRFRIFKTEKIDRNSDEPGAIIELSKEKLIVGTGQGSLSLLEVQTEGKKRMPIEEFMKGTRLAIGDKLGI